MKYILHIAVFCFFISCGKEDKTIKLYYTLYIEGISQPDSLIFEYYENDTVRFVSLKSHSGITKFKEKVTADGIYRSPVDSLFQKTHSFTRGVKIESNIGQLLPMIITKWSTLINSYKIPLHAKDSADIFFYDEVIPFYSFASTYYLKSAKVFLIYYDQQKNNYFKLSKIEGIEKGDEILNIANKLAQDTVFFGPFYKLPKVEAPSF